jgi:hypothetical protein
LFFRIVKTDKSLNSRNVIRKKFCRNKYNKLSFNSICEKITKNRGIGTCINQTISATRERETIYFA